MSPSRRLTAAVIAALAAAGLTAPGASAQAILMPKCVIGGSGERTLPIVAGPFSPGAFVRVRTGDTFVTSGQAGDDGVLRTIAFPPSFKSFRHNLQSFSLVAEDTTSGLVTPPVTLQVVRRTVEAPSRAKPRSRIRFRLFGFPVGRNVYLHVRRGGKTLRTVKVGKAAAPCGRLSKRMRALPLTRYRTGTYEYWWGSRPRASKASTLYRQSINIFRTFS